MKQYKLLLGILLICCSFFVVACEPTMQPENKTTQTYSFETQDLSIQQFASQDELEAFLATHAESNSYSGYGIRTLASSAVVKMDTMVALESTSIAYDDGASVDYSETNVQVAGVDELDIIKTDGEYIYTTTDDKLFIIKAYPGEESEVISTIDLAGYAQGLFIDADTLVVVGYTDNQNDDETFDEEDIERLASSVIVPNFYESYTYMYMYDISDKENPTEIEHTLYEGSYVEGRLKDNVAYILTRTYLYEDRPYPMPFLVKDGIAKMAPVNSMYYFGYNYDNPTYLTVYATNTQTQESESTTVVVEGSQTVYMSENNIYITSSEWINEYDIAQEVTTDYLLPKLPQEYTDKIDRINAVDNDILSQYEKEYKVENVFDEYMQTLSSKEQIELEDTLLSLVKKELKTYDYFEYTIIQKIAYDGLKMTPVATTKVPGSLSNQFSLDEHDAVLRLATTVNAHWSSFMDTDRTESENHIYTLDEDLDVLDAVTGIAQDERIYATRFIDDRLYLVTYKQVDPFFVVDLSDAENIEILGELKIPGFSRYLHPYDENTIIGIGQDTTENGRTSGLKISLFDVSDVANPTEITSFVGDDTYAYSSALYEHKAFLFNKEKELLVIPVNNYDWKDEDNSYNGAFVFHITKDDISMRGLIDHSMTTSSYWSSGVERSLYIEDLLYTKSPYLLRVHAINDLSSVANVTLSVPKSPEDIVVY